MKKILTVWVFDVDGVLTDPKEKKVLQQEIFFELEKRLKKGEPVVLNTGRSLDFVIKQILDPLEKKISGISLLDNFFVVGEKGSVWLEYSQGARKEDKDDETVVLESIIEEVRNLVKKKFIDVMFFDETKQTMVSVEMNDGLDFDLFSAKQKDLDQTVLEILKKKDFDNKYRIDSSLIATDIESRHAGKALGANRIWEWLKNKQFVPDQMYIFGDSLVDTQMAEEFHKKGVEVIFVFLGEKELLKDYTAPFEIIFTKDLYGDGVVSFLGDN